MLIWNAGPSRIRHLILLRNFRGLRSTLGNAAGRRSAPRNDGCRGVQQFQHGVATLSPVVRRVFASWKRMGMCFQYWSM